jgi:putative intracellular protease/amidase
VSAAGGPPPRPAKGQRPTVGVVLFEGFELLDVFGPLEMLGGDMDIAVMAERAGPVASSQGPACVAEAAMADADAPDVLLVPGGFGTRREVANAAFLAELARLAGAARLVASVCTGSALLAKAGILDGKRATSNKRAFAWVASQGPRVDWVAQARWVEDGRFFTSSGVSAGMDMALGLLERMLGREASLGAAQAAEYEWHEDWQWDPFARLNGLA